MTKLPRLAASQVVYRTAGRGGVGRGGAEGGAGREVAGVVVGGGVGALLIRVVRGKSRITASLGRDASGHLSRLTALLD